MTKTVSEMWDELCVRYRETFYWAEDMSTNDLKRHIKNMGIRELYARMEREKHVKERGYPV